MKGSLGFLFLVIALSGCAQDSDRANSPEGVRTVTVTPSPTAAPRFETNKYVTFVDHMFLDLIRQEVLIGKSSSRSDDEWEAMGIDACNALDKSPMSRTFPRNKVPLLLLDLSQPIRKEGLSLEKAVSVIMASAMTYCPEFQQPIESTVPPRDRLHW